MSIAPTPEPTTAATAAGAPWLSCATSAWRSVAFMRSRTSPWTSVRERSSALSAATAPARRR